VLWVDSLCIKQKDLVERGLRVRRMGLIYSRAAEVVVWLGEEADDSAMAMSEAGGSSRKVLVPECNHADVWVSSQDAQGCPRSLVPATVLEKCLDYPRYVDACCSCGLETLSLDPQSMSHDTYSYSLNTSSADLIHRGIENSKVASCLGFTASRWTVCSLISTPLDLPT